MVKFEKLGPLLIPEKEYQAKFNAGMIEAGGQVHMLYRFCEKREEWYNKPIDWLNWIQFPYVKDYICYAKLDCNGNLQYDNEVPVIFPEREYESLGCEDPRIVPFEGLYYIFYCAVRPDPIKKLSTNIAIAKTDDFRSYQKLGVIEDFTDDKDAFIFPERINGKIALMHRVLPEIQIDYFDSFEEMLSPDSWKDYQSRVEASTAIKRTASFESTKIGGGVPPIKTEDGWLLIYHAVDSAKRYHAAAALLDLNDPFKIKAKLPYPVMSPEEDFETSGDYMGCVFPQGYYIKGDELYISYGTADKYTAIAKTNLDGLIRELKRYTVI